MPAIRILGRGRAGGALAGAMRGVGWTVDLVGHEDAADAAVDVDLVVLAVPDDAVSTTAQRLRPSSAEPPAVVAHMAGSLGLDVLAPHARRASVHPLVALPDPDLGAAGLAAGSWFAVAGDGIASDLVRALGGHAITVDDDHRAEYHAAAVIASNHLVALLAQVDRVAQTANVPFAAYLDLVRATVDNVALLGPPAALTGPAARGDDATIARHLEALAPEERALYTALADACRKLAAAS